MTKHKVQSGYLLTSVLVCCGLASVDSAFAGRSPTTVSAPSDANKGASLPSTGEAVREGKHAREKASQDNLKIRLNTSNPIDWAKGNVTDGLGAKVVGKHPHDGVAVGRDAVATGGNVALGAFSHTNADLNATAFNPGSEKLAAAIAKGEVSIGAKDKERRITNVAAGSGLTDAVNVSQLVAQNKKVDRMGNGTAAALGGGATYDPASGDLRNPSYKVGETRFSDVGSAISELDHQQRSAGELNVTYADKGRKEVILQGASTKITNLAAGDVSDKSRDAVNGAQLWGVRQDVGKLNVQMNDITEGRGIKFFHVNGKFEQGTDLLPGDSSATGEGSVAIGGSAASVGKGSVSLGSYAHATGSGAVAIGNNSVADRDNTVSVGSVGKDGRTPVLRQITNVGAGTEDTDAVNMRQLRDAGLLDRNGKTQDAVVYDSASNRRTVSFGGVGAELPVVLTNVGNGRIAPDSTDAVNGGQLFELTGRVDNLEKRNAKSEPERRRATEQRKVDGADGGGRRIAHVDAGVQDTDAANVAQLNAAVDTGVNKAHAYTDEQMTQLRSQVDHNRKDASGGSASAIAISNLPQAFPGESMMSVAGGAFDGQSAVALGLSTSTRKWAVKASVTANTRGSYGGGAGVGYRF